MHNSDFMAGQKMLLKYLRAKLVKFFLIFLVFPSKIKPNMHKFGFAGQIRSFRGPYVVHAWSNSLSSVLTSCLDNLPYIRENCKKNPKICPKLKFLGFFLFMILKHTNTVIVENLYWAKKLTHV